MRVGELALEDFRNYRRAGLRWEPGLNLVTGRNAQGKTNLLEAVHHLTGLGAPRGDAATVVREGATEAFIHGDVVRGDRTVHIDMEIRKGRTRALVNGSPLGRTRNLAEHLVTVFFGPDELALVKAGPDGRRRFLDDIVVKLRPARSALRRDLEKVVRQRNALLKSLRADTPASPAERLAVWDEQLVRAGTALGRARLEALAYLLPRARLRYVEIAGGGELDVTYVSSWLAPDAAASALDDPGAITDEELAAGLKRRIAELRHVELERGLTLVGPQRDDIAVWLSGAGAPRPLEARTYASQGDQRTAALALKLAEHDILTETLGEAPVLLLDDVFSELDRHRRSWLARAVAGIEQTIVSSAEPLDLEELEARRVFAVQQGVVTVA